MNDGWIMVRLRRSTAARLRTVEQSLRRAYEMGKIGLDFDAQGRVSIDQVVDILIQRQFEHQDRSKKAARRRSKKKAIQALKEMNRVNG